jgi:hypothetical protein
MSDHHRTQSSAFPRSLVAMLALVALLFPQIVCADPLLFLFKDDTSKTPQEHEAIRGTAMRPAVLDLTKNGNLVVKCGSINMVLAYSQPEEPLKQLEPVRRTVAMNREAQIFGGISISVNFTF